jgi:hypothetical protein
MRIGALVLVLLAACSSRDEGPPTPDTGTVPVDGGADADSAVPMDSRPPPSDVAPPDAIVCTDALDVVFVIDVSTSMADEIDQVRGGMDRIWAAAEALTTDTQFGLVVFVDDVVAVNGCAPFADLATMQAEFIDWREFTSTNAQPGGGASSNTDCPENSLDALYTAATTCPWRPDATHIVIHVTDDTFVESPLTLSSIVGIGGIMVQNTYLETIDALVAAEVRVGSFAAPGMGEWCGAGTSPNVGQGFHEPYNSAESIPDATGGAVWSIRDVRAGTLDMAEAINEFTEAEYCTLF